LQAHLLQQARQELTDNELFALLSLMGYKPQRYLFDELTALLQLSSSTILALHRGFLSPKAAKLFKSISCEDQDMLVQLIDTYRPGGSKQHRLIEMIIELSLRNSKPVQEVIRELMPANHDCAQDNAPQRLQVLLHSLQKMYWPERTKLERKFHKFIQELHLPDGVTVESTTSFEDERVELHFHFFNSEVLREKWNLIKTVIQR
jgi:ParB family chromosome partitioning protein